MPEISDTDIATAATTPASASADGQSVTARSVDDLIKAKTFTDQNDAAEKVHRGLRFTKLKPPGAV